MIAIHQATISDLDRIAPLFDGYRQFYGQRSDVAGARAFLLERFGHSESVIFVASRDGAAIGFTQLYPSFSSISLARIYVLSDLYVVSAARKLGAGRLLLEAAAKFARSLGAHQLTLETAVTNRTAQALYEACGWVKDTEFYVYQLTLPTP
ncbi:MAG TPA: GNAT family N-acetyltransferase [Steroidobacteraceae bacterium]|jgi:GNAT superfamily N-acetyltransferase|nr:GNAT family N-acetyltransferase [Steroidobacteraceae bacterium]